MIPLVSPYGATTNSTPVFLPLFTSEPLSTSTATTAVIFIHGLRGNAQDYFCMGYTASLPRLKDTLVAAPWFGNETSTGSYWGPGNPRDTSLTLFWSNSRWSTGGTNTAPPKGFSTAFDELDALVAALPSTVTLVSVVGFSAGAQMSGRYAFATPLGATQPGRPHIRFIVSDPGSFLYFADSRPLPSCSPLKDTGAGHTCTEFAPPSTPTDCPGYNDYKYGLNALGYLNLYLAPLDSNATARAAAVARFPTRDVVYFLGSQDTCNCNSEGYTLPPDGHCKPEGGGLVCTPDAAGGKGCCDTFPDSDSSNALDVSCAGMLQGSNRLQRGLNYVGHLKDVFEGHSPVIYLGPFAHNASGLFNDPTFQKIAYTL